MRAVLLLLLAALVGGCSQQSANAFVWGPGGGPAVGDAPKWTRECLTDRLSGVTRCSAMIRAVQRVPYPYDFVTFSVRVNDAGSRWSVVSSAYQESARIRPNAGSVQPFVCAPDAACIVEGDAALRLTLAAMRSDVLMFEMYTYRGLVGLDFPVEGLATAMRP